jgi:hypothetical protein
MIFESSSNGVFPIRSVRRFAIFVMVIAFSFYSLQSCTRLLFRKIP